MSLERRWRVVGGERDDVAELGRGAAGERGVSGGSVGGHAIGVRGAAPVASENAELRTEREILRKEAAHFAQETIRSAASGSSRAPTGLWRQAALSSPGSPRSGFYAWRARPPSQRSLNDAELGEVIVEIHRRSRCTYGAPRVHGELARLGRRCGRKRVARLMRAHGLVGVHARRRWRRGRFDVAPAPDLVGRNFNPAGPDRLWAADITQFRTDEGWLHLAAVIDLWSRRVVGWAMHTSATAELVSDALVMAFELRRPDRRVVHHSGLHLACVLASGRRTRAHPVVRFHW